MNTPECVADINGITRKFGKKVALDNVTLQIPRGRVFGLVGENGAGKTTLIKLMLGLLRPNAGSVRVFGVDPVQDPEAALSKIGYLSEDRDLPHWMRVRELIAYTRAFYPKWDDTYCNELVRTFGLDLDTKVKNLSRGQKAQAGLLIALAYRPELLLLDEPSSGLDAVVRRDILGAIIRTVADEGRTVIFSSHLLDEVERVADDVAMIHCGKLVMNAPLDEVKASHHRLTVQLKNPTAQKLTIPGALHCEGTGRDWVVISDGKIEQVRTELKAMDADIIEEASPSLEDIFVARVGTERGVFKEATA